MSKFQQRHYEAVADVIRSRYEDAPFRFPSACKAYKTALKDVAEDFADRFARDNPAFKRRRFLRACGMED